ncbi:MAG TPA: polyhydroxyalkanoate depolymerase [Alphaproteobacteria bacterium]|nr:polyhydroxyalkanoate depolymerase [Alphaproteobacteria bacterium]
MLYHLYDWHHAAWEPVRLFVQAGQRLFSHPALPFSYTGMGRTAAAVCEMVERGTRRYAKPAFGFEHTTIDGEIVEVVEETVLERTFCKLKHFRRATKRNDPRLLIVAPLSGHHATLLRGTVQALLPAHDVYITDWISASEVPLKHGDFNLDDYIDYVVGFLRHIGPGAHVMAVCQPSVPVLAAVSIMSAEGDKAAPRSMTMMGGPIDTRKNPTKVNDVATGRSFDWFERTVITYVPQGHPGAGRRVYPGFLQLSGFMAMNIDRHFGAQLQMFRHLVQGDGESAASHRRFYDEYLSVMDLPAEFYLQTIDTVFQKHALPRGIMTSRNRKVEPSKIAKTGLLTIEGELDDISGIGQTRAAHDLCTGIPAERHRHYEAKGVGHYGIFNGRRWREDIMPRVRDFIREND